MNVGDGYGSWYNRTDMAQQLAANGCDEATVQEILAALDIGNTGILSEKNLDGKVQIKQFRNFIPTPGKFEKGDFEKVLFKLQTFDFMSAMQLLFEVSKQMRDTNREMRHGDRELAFQASMSAAGAMKDAAKSEMWASIISASTSLVASAASGILLGKGNEAGARLASQLGESLSQFGGIHHKLDAANKKASEAEFNANAQKHQSMESEDSDYQKTAAEFIQHVISMLREITQNQLETDQRIMQNI